MGLGWLRLGLGLGGWNPSHEQARVKPVLVVLRAQAGLHALAIGGAACVDVLSRRVAADERDCADRRVVAQEVDSVMRACR